MIEAQGKVIAVDRGTVWVHPEDAANCSDCQQKGSCGVGLMAGASGGRGDIRLPNSLDVREGDRVTMGVSEGAVIRASLWMYGLPLAAMAGGSLCAQQLGAGEPLTVLAGFLGLFGGFFWARHQTRPGGSPHCYAPQLVDVEKGEGHKNTSASGDPASI